jgi:hypothetical protein
MRLKKRAYRYSRLKGLRRGVGLASWMDSGPLSPGRLTGSPLRATVAEARRFRRTRQSGLPVYRCNVCQQIYNLSNGTIFHQRHLTPYQVVLLVRGSLKGEPSKTLAAKLDLHYTTVLELRHDLPDHADAARMPMTTRPSSVRWASNWPSAPARGVGYNYCQACVCPRR